ncbi:MAG: hypothetical protein FWC89_02860 [Defluviitaleaceae bacterium]|nr:hypothetical protein [Defluviitaleaceae bacterium]
MKKSFVLVMSIIVMLLFIIMWGGVLLVIIFARPQVQPAALWFTQENPATGNIVRVEYALPFQRHNYDHSIYIYVNDILMYETNLYNRRQELTANNYSFEWTEVGALLNFYGEGQVATRRHEIQYAIIISKSDITMVLTRLRLPLREVETSEGGLFASMRGTRLDLWFTSINTESGMRIQTGTIIPFRGPHRLYLYVNDTFVLQTQSTIDDSAFRPRADGFYIEWLPNGAILTMFVDRDVEVRYQLDVVGNDIAYTELYRGRHSQ